MSFELRIDDFSEEIKQLAQEAVNKALARCGAQAQTYASNLAPVDTGALRNSIAFKVEPDEKTAYVGSNSEYAEIDNKYKWNIEEIYKDDNELKCDIKKLKNSYNFDDFKNKLNNKESILNCFKKLYSCYLILEKISIYAMMKQDENSLDSYANNIYEIVDSLSNNFSNNISFINPELSNLSNEFLKELLNDTEFKDYDNDINDIIKSKIHTLSEKEERILSLSGSVISNYHSIFNYINNADFQFPSIMVNGKKTKVTHATYSELLQNPDKNVRKKVYKSYYNAYFKVLNVITATYRGNLYKDVFLYKARNFESSLDRALFNEDIDKCVYENLLKSVNKNVNVLHDYIAFRKQVLNYKTLNMYDLYLPMYKGVELKLDYEDAYSLVEKGLSCLGEDYINLLERAKNERWIDVYESEGKRSGAYSVCGYNLKHPYVLLNHTKTTHSVFTIAHEMGHSIHSYKSNLNQPQQKADYKIFVAEVASTVNEVLLVKYLIKNAKTIEEKKYFLSYYLDTIRTTLFRQTMFAEFEYEAHKLVENDEPATKEKLCEIYKKLNKKYYGKSVVTDKEISYEWARIPHFYRSFYVYKYSTGIISAIVIAENILKFGENYIEKYFKFLSSGSSDIPTELLKIADVDLTKVEPFDIAMQSFKNTLEELKNLG